MRSVVSAIRLLLTLRCEQSTRIVSESLDRELSAVERWSVRLHYISCWSCRRFGKQIRQMRDVMTQHPGKLRELELSAEAMKRIEQAINRTS